MQIFIKILWTLTHTHTAEFLWGMLHVTGGRDDATDVNIVKKTDTEQKQKQKTVLFFLVLFIFSNSVRQFIRRARASIHSEGGSEWVIHEHDPTRVLMAAAAHPARLQCFIKDVELCSNCAGYLKPNR